MSYLVLIWIVGFIPTVIFAHHRLMVNYRAGFIRDPWQPEGWLTMMFNCAIWFYTMPRYFIEYRQSRNK